MHLSTSDLQTVGRDLCRAILVYCDLSVPNELQAINSSPSIQKLTEGLDKKHL
jgi:hypothetical protein